ncbi:cysteine desulfurase family protein (TIGR01976 family) [Gillisia mitskevichiae]|uniref:Cysteine desulfurase family protein (TIGR01976 family) n=1 Tax=Gillisia mitskevichiae TaxID=270921 RepID=A0A495PWM6_9FLAO|nr:cysteine desulfurase-like protein [Gillisia mitskevichiae]RKS55542.1 cysteine desulfurase family protein (TIGR01976 family) [Gillisia mitskevichiae]
MDIDYIREQFPSLKKGYTFMDNAGGSQILGSSINCISEYFLNYNVQLGASYEVSANAGKALSHSTEKIAEYLNVFNPKEVIIGPSSTMLLRILSICISHSWKAGDEIIITNTDHEANVSCWKDLENKGIKIKIWKVNPSSFELELNELSNLLSNKTKLVAVTHCSNVLGSINPIKEISKIVHEAGALICVDGVAFAPHRRVNVQELDIDFYVFSWYKVFGPHLAVMYGKLPLLIDMPGINHQFFKPEDVPYKFQPGNYNFELTYSLKAIPDYMIGIYDHHFSNNKFSRNEKLDASFELIAAYEAQLAQALLSYLRSVEDIKIIGASSADASLRVPTISFIHSKFKSSEIVEFIDKKHIGIRYGDFYAKQLIKDLDLEQYEGVVRVSLAHYNTLEEVKNLIAAFKEIF